MRKDDGVTIFRESEICTVSFVLAETWNADRTKRERRRMVVVVTWSETVVPVNGRRSCFKKTVRWRLGSTSLHACLGPTVPRTPIPRHDPVLAQYHQAHPDISPNFATCSRLIVCQAESPSYVPSLLDRPPFRILVLSRLNSLQALKSTPFGKRYYSTKAS